LELEQGAGKVGHRGLKGGYVRDMFLPRTGPLGYDIWCPRMQRDKPQTRLHELETALYIKQQNLPKTFAHALAFSELTVRAINIS
jgi:hypothetical protein